MDADSKAADFPIMCSFCDKNQTQVRRIIAGSKAFICDECVHLCYEMVNEISSKDVDALVAVAARHGVKLIEGQWAFTKRQLERVVLTILHGRGSAE